MLSLSPQRKVHSSTSFLRRPKTLVANGNVVHLQERANTAIASTIQQAPWPPRNDEEYNKSRKSAPNLLEELRPSVVAAGNIQSKTRWLSDDVTLYYTRRIEQLDTRPRRHTFHNRGKYFLHLFRTFIEVKHHKPVVLVLGKPLLLC